MIVSMIPGGKKSSLICGAYGRNVLKRQKGFLLKHLCIVEARNTDLNVGN